MKLCEDFKTFLLVHSIYSLQSIASLMITILCVPKSRFQFTLWVVNHSLIFFRSQIYIFALDGWLIIQIQNSFTKIHLRKQTFFSSNTCLPIPWSHFKVLVESPSGSLFCIFWKADHGWYWTRRGDFCTLAKLAELVGLGLRGEVFKGKGYLTTFKSTAITWFEVNSRIEISLPPFIAITRLFDYFD